jgi:hypothetical protein
MAAAATSHDIFCRLRRYFSVCCACSAGSEENGTMAFASSHELLLSAYICEHLWPTPLPRCLAPKTEMAQSENYDALTGAPLRDKAYTWGASAFLILAHELLAK